MNEITMFTLRYLLFYELAIQNKKYGKPAMPRIKALEIGPDPLDLNCSAA